MLISYEHLICNQNAYLREKNNKPDRLTLMQYGQMITNLSRCLDSKL